MMMILRQSIPAVLWEECRAAMVVAGLAFGMCVVSHAFADTSQLNFTGSFKSSGCTVNTPDLTIPLGNWTTADFDGVGSTTTLAPLNLRLDCPSATNVSVNVAAAEIGSQPGTFRLNAGSGMASGIGVQLIDGNGVPLPINTTISLGRALNTYSPDWKARYIQTLSTVTAGDASATAVATFTYN